MPTFCLLVVDMAKVQGLEALFEPVITALGCELLGLEFVSQGRHSLLRVYIDREDGVRVEDCEAVSRQLSALLDVEDPIPGQYSLEVSSPGLDRPLFKAEHFARFLDHESVIRLKSQLDGRRKYRGVLREVQDGNVVIECDGVEFTLPLDMIDKANLVPDVKI